MADVMAVVDQNYWRVEQSRWNAPLEPGDLLDDWRSYRTRNPLIAEYHRPGDRIFLVTARGEALWLIAVYEDVGRPQKRGAQFKWVALRANRVPIIDLTPLRTRLRFHTGKGLTTEPRKLGSSLQTPRCLTDTDVALLEREIAAQGAYLKPPTRRSPATEAEEGRRIVRELSIPQRDRALAREALIRDEHTCRCCGFRVDKLRFPKLAEHLGTSIVHVHHVKLVSRGRRKNSANDLLTLCPTCHAVAHAIASATGSESVGLDLLQQFYRPV